VSGSSPAPTHSEGTTRPAGRVEAREGMHAEIPEKRVIQYPYTCTYEGKVADAS
jgi:hypothetical protein